MNRKIWLFIAIVLLSGPTVLPISLEAFFLVELVGFLGIWSICSSYVYAICAHPYTRRFWACFTSPEQHWLTHFPMMELKRHPSLLIHMLPYRSVVAWSIPTLVSVLLMAGFRF